jgi:predicted transporter
MRKIVIGAIALMFILNSEIYSLAVVSVGMAWGLSRFFTAVAQSGKF